MALPANPVIHLRGEDVVTDPVSTWPDQSGNGNDFTQGVAANRPTLVSNELNGYTVVRFDGTNDAMERTQTLNQPATVAVVARPAHASDAMVAWGGWNPASTSQVGGLVRLETAQWSIFAGTNLLSGVAQSTDWRILVGRFNGGSSRFTVDSTAVDGNAGTRNTGNLRVGSYNTAGSNGGHWDGDVAEVVVWPRSLSDAEMEDTRVFFDGKFFTAPPSAPTNPAAVAQSDSEIRVTWDDVADETGFRVERSLNGSSGWADVSGNLAADTVLYDDSGLSASTQYFYRVFAFNAGGDSPASSTVNATTTGGGGGGNRMGGTGAIRRSPRTPR